MPATVFVVLCLCVYYSIGNCIHIMTLVISLTVPAVATTLQYLKWHRHYDASKTFGITTLATLLAKVSQHYGNGVICIPYCFKWPHMLTFHNFLYVSKWLPYYFLILKCLNVSLTYSHLCPRMYAATSVNYTNCY